MIRDITIGQYYPAKSVLHELDPRVKLFSTFIYILALFLYKGLVGLGVITLFMVSIIALSKVPVKYMIKGLKAILVLLLFSCFFNLMFTSGDVVYWEYGIFSITDKSVVSASTMAIRLIYLILGTSLMTLTTTPNQLTDGLETSLKPLNKIHVPVHAIAMMMSIALRFIPILLEETDKIMKAQMARGADFESGGLIKKAKSMIPLLVPLFVSAFRRADDLAMAMEARCYNGGEGRTKMKPLKYKAVDGISYIVVLLFLAAVIACRIVWPTYIIL